MTCYNDNVSGNEGTRINGVTKVAMGHQEQQHGGTIATYRADSTCTSKIHFA